MSATRDRIEIQTQLFGICLEYFESVIDHAGNDTGVFTDVPERY